MQQNELVIFVIIRAHRMHKMRSVATHVAWSICVLTVRVCLLPTTASSTTAAEPIDYCLGCGSTSVGPTGPDPSRARGHLGACPPIEIH